MLLSEAKFLVVEDTPALATAIAERLESRGATIRIAANRVEAIKCVENWSPDFVIQDQQIPLQEREDADNDVGVETLKEILRKDQRCEAVLITAYPDVGKAFDLGAFSRRVRGYLDRKTFRGDSLLDFVAREIKNKEARDRERLIILGPRPIAQVISGIENERQPARRLMLVRDLMELSLRFLGCIFLASTTSHRRESGKLNSLLRPGNRDWLELLRVVTAQGSRLADYEPSLSRVVFHVSSDFIIAEQKLLHLRNVQFAHGVTLLDTEIESLLASHQADVDTIVRGLLLLSAFWLGSVERLDYRGNRFETELSVFEGPGPEKTIALPMAVPLEREVLYLISRESDAGAIKLNPFIVSEERRGTGKRVLLFDSFQEQKVKYVCYEDGSSEFYPRSDKRYKEIEVALGLGRRF
jgi:CheY-like chemotaxis protein